MAISLTSVFFRAIWSLLSRSSLLWPRLLRFGAPLFKGVVTPRSKRGSVWLSLCWVWLDVLCGGFFFGLFGCVTLFYVFDFFWTIFCCFVVIRDGVSFVWFFF